MPQKALSTSVRVKQLTGSEEKVEALQWGRWANMSSCILNASTEVSLKQQI